MKTRSHFLLTGILAVLVPHLGAQDLPVRRLPVPSRVVAGEYAGASSNSVTIGAGRIALGSWTGRNDAGLSTGNVSIYDEATGALRFTLAPSDGEAGDLFGASVAISGNLIAIGAPKHSHSGHAAAGAVYVFDLTTRRLVQKLANGSFLAGEHWGQSVAMDGRRVLIGASDADFGAGPRSGAVVVWNVGEPSYSTVMTAPGAAAGDEFGVSVAMQGWLIAVGAPGTSVAGAAGAGRVHLFDSKTSSYLSSVTADVSTASDGMGHSVALDRHQLIAGAPGAASLSGKVCSWDVSMPSSPLLVATIYGNPGERWGAAVGFSQNVVAIGTSGRALTGPPFSANVGGVILTNRYLRTIIANVQPSDLHENDVFGAALCLSGSTLAVSAPGDDTGVTDGGVLWKCGPVAVPDSHLFTNVHMASGLVPSGVGAATYSRPVEAVDCWGQAAFTSQLAGPDSTRGRGRGLFSAANPAFLVGLAKQTGIMESGVSFTGISGLTHQLSSGDLYARASLAGPAVTSATSRAICRQNRATGVFSPMLRTGATLASGEVVSSIGIVRVNDARNFALINVGLRPGTGSPSVSGLSDSAITIWGDGAYVGMRREGLSMSPLGVAYGQMPALINVAGDRSFMVASVMPGTAGVTTANNVFVDQNASVAARKGDIAPDSLGSSAGVFHSFSGACGSSSGTAFKAVLAPLAGVTAANNEGLWTNRSGSLRLILRKGAPAPELPAGVKIRRIVKHGINTAGGLLILAQVAGNGVNASNDLVIYANDMNLAEPGDFHVLVREGDIVPGGRGERYGSILNVDFTSIPTFNNSSYGALVTLRSGAGVSASNNLVWIAGRLDAFSADVNVRRVPDVQLRKGTRVTVSPGQPVAVSSFSLGTQVTDTAGALNGGMGHAMERNFGSATLKVQLADRRQMVVSVSR